MLLDDHFTAEEINSGIAQRRGFQRSFDGLADDDLDELRALFRRKALINRQQRLVKALLDAGTSAGELGRLRLGDLPPSPELAAYTQRRAELGLDVGPGRRWWSIPTASPSRTSCSSATCGSPA